MADIDFTHGEVLQVSCAWRSIMMLKIVSDNLAATSEDALSEVALLNERISFLEKKISSLDQDKTTIDAEMDAQQSLLASVADNAISRLGMEAHLDDFDLVFNDDEVKCAVIGMNRVVATEK